MSTADQPIQKPIRVTADTNAFFYLGSSALSKADVVGPGEHLWATPINVLEIVAGVPLLEWNVRRDAAKAVVAYADNMAGDPEEHLAAMIERRAPVPGAIWLEAAKGLGQATSASELLSGVADFSERVVRTVKASIAAGTKGTHYEAFRNEVIKVCDDLVPGYRDAVENGLQAPIVDKPNREKIRAYLSSPEFVATVFFAGLVQRYQLFGTHKLDLESDSMFDVLRDLAPYCGIYGAYLRELLTTRRKPETNDWGDLELFIYLQPGTFVATTEKKWWAFADLAGLGGRVRRLVPKAVK